MYVKGSGKLRDPRVTEDRLIQLLIQSDEPPRWKDPLQTVPPLTIARQTYSHSSSLSRLTAHKRSSTTDQVMDIFGLHVPESTAEDADLALFLRRLRKPVQPDVNEIQEDLDRHKQIKDQIIAEDMAQAPPSPGRRHNPGYTPPKIRPRSLVSTSETTEPEYNADRSFYIEQTARMLGRKMRARRY